MTGASSGRSRILSVSEVTAHVRNLFELDPLLQNVWVRGEIADYKPYPKSGHIYFTLKDENAAIQCVMFKTHARNLDFSPESGMKVLARGYLTIFERQGRYQLYVEEMEPDGVGRMFMALMQLKERLEKEGLFDPAKKRPIPAYARCVGVVTSPSGAAFRDIVKVARERNPHCRIVIAGAAVQGDEAPGQIAQAIADLNAWGEPDVLIVGRGGGSFEDLWAFNTEAVVRAVAGSAIPIISAVGHEIDFSLADLAADLRAATPTQAAQMAVYDASLVFSRLSQSLQAMVRAAERGYNLKWAELDYLMGRRIWHEPQAMYAGRAQELEGSRTAMQKNMSRWLEVKRLELGRSAAAMDSLSPLKVLNRGYSLTTNQAGRLITSVHQTAPGDILRLQVRDGHLTVQVIEEEYEDGKAKL